MDLSFLDLNVFWFGLLGLLLFGYAALDGFDLGVGILHPAFRDDRDRRIVLNSIGPIWDGNEVWLVVFGGAMFAVFPEAYATVFSGFYLPFMLLLCALIYRAVSIEFRSKVASPLWRSFFDYAFCISSALASFLFGVAIGNVLAGMPIGPDREFAGTPFDLVGPYQILVGLLVVALFAMHGSIYLYLKTEGDLQRRVRSKMWSTFGVFMTLYVLTTIYTLARLPHVTANFEHLPLAWIVPVLNVLAVANIPRAIYLERPVYAFASSVCTMLAFVFLLGMALFPNVVVSSLEPAHSLTIYNAASSPKTLLITAIIALVGMPLVLTYTSIVYWIFRGKVKLGEFSY
jgi:cytochrome bd ubiquinol oxidase subunit II